MIQVPVWSQSIPALSVDGGGKRRQRYEEEMARWRRLRLSHKLNSATRSGSGSPALNGRYRHSLCFRTSSRLLEASQHVDLLYSKPEISHNRPIIHAEVMVEGSVTSVDRCGTAENTDYPEYLTGLPHNPHTAGDPLKTPKHGPARHLAPFTRPGQ